MGVTRATRQNDKAASQLQGLEVDENNGGAGVSAKAIAEQLGPHDSLSSITNPRRSHLLNQFFQ